MKDGLPSIPSTGIYIAVMVVVTIVTIGSALPERKASGSPAGQSVAEPASGPCQPSTEKRDAAASFIRASGYDCMNVDTMCSYTFSEGYTVFCDHRYQFEIENHGGKWSVRSH